MSKKNNNVLYYNRQDLTGLGSSRLELFEITKPGQVNTINIGGKLIKLKPVAVQDCIPPHKAYVVIETYDNTKLTVVDILYGSLDISNLRKDKDATEKLFEDILTRENLKVITSSYLGLIPYDTFVDPYGKMGFKYRNGEAKELARIVLESSYIENRISPPKPRIRNQEEGFFDKLFGTKKRKSTTELGSYQGENNKSNEGVIFFRSGVIIRNNSIFLKFNYATKDSQTKEKTKVNDILVSNFDEERLADDTFRKRFVEEIFNPVRLNNSRTVSDFRYVGGVDDKGNMVYDPLIWADFNELSERWKIIITFI